jgi:hypothetical protein
MRSLDFSPAYLLLQSVTGVASGRGHDACCAGMRHASDMILTLFLSRETGLFKGLCVTRHEKYARDRLTLLFAVDESWKKVASTRSWGFTLPRISDLRKPRPIPNYRASFRDLQGALRATLIDHRGIFTECVSREGEP